MHLMVEKVDSEAALSNLVRPTAFDRVKHHFHKVVLASADSGRSFAPGRIGPPAQW